MSRFDSMRGHQLDSALAVLNVVRRTESDADLIQRAREQLGLQRAAGTLSALEGAIDLTIANKKAAGTKHSAVKREFAIIWLGREKPAGLFARLRWWLDLFGRLRSAS